jgi:hypothetical protein
VQGAGGGDVRAGVHAIAVADAGRLGFDEGVQYGPVGRQLRCGHAHSGCLGDAYVQRFADVGQPSVHAPEGSRDGTVR